MRILAKNLDDKKNSLQKNMAVKRVMKKRVVTSINNLPQELQDLVKAHYPTGYTEAMMRIDKPNGDFFYAVPYATDEIDYLVKIDVKIDDKSHEDDDKGFFDDEIKDEPDMSGAENMDDDDDM